MKKEHINLQKYLEDSKCCYIKYGQHRRPTVCNGTVLTERLNAFGQRNRLVVPDNGS